MEARNGTCMGHPEEELPYFIGDLPHSSQLKA